MFLSRRRYVLNQLHIAVLLLLHLQKDAVMSLHPQPIAPVPEQTAQMAHAACPKGKPSLTLRDQLGTMFQDEDFATLFPAWGYPGLSPWRLALVMSMQFRDNLSDRQAAEAVRARIDWKYLLSLELTEALGRFW